MNFVQFTMTIGFEQVGTHTSNVTYVVTYVVGDNGRVTRVVFRDTSFNFTYQVGKMCIRDRNRPWKNAISSQKTHL